MTRIRLDIFLFLCFFILIISCEATEPDPIGQISGVVMDDSLKIPMNGAFINLSINQVADTTDSLGSFYFDSLTVGFDTLTIISTSEIYDTLNNVIDIQKGLQEINISLKWLPCFDDRPTEDTTRQYVSTKIGFDNDYRVLQPVNLNYFYVRFDTSVTDTKRIDSLIHEYNLTFAVNSSGGGEYIYFSERDHYYYTILCVPEGKRPEIYFTPYGKKNFCNFGSEPMVDYSFAVFGDGVAGIFGDLLFTFNDSVTHETIYKFFDQYGLRLIYFDKSTSDLWKDLWVVLVTPKSPMNIMDLMEYIKREDIINQAKISVVGGGFGNVPKCQ
ncbi:MAG: hypothetical protein ISR89_09130 [Candidatus Marinimicrobia bacterium]|nr:hypothetical protein [Candidatus Neomarinimicrobiota bacterium]MBL7031316.1 hypothetical protein [Candidatus Neomarinimicrobiota bacterium]